MQHLQTAPPTTPTNHALHNIPAAPLDALTNAPQINSVEAQSSLFSVSVRAKLAWKPSEANVLLRSGDTGATQAQMTTSSPANAILAGDYDGAIQALSCGGFAAAPCRPTSDHSNLAGISALGLLAERPAPLEFIRAFLAKVAQLQPDAIDAPDGSGQTALTRAVRSNDLELIKLLLDAGADPAACDGKSESALQIAATNGNALLLALIHSHLATTELSGAEQKLIADLYKARNTEGLRGMAGISPKCERSVMKYIVNELVQQFSELSSDCADDYPPDMRSALQQFLPLLDTTHQYRLLLKLLESGADAPRLMLEVCAPRLSADQLRIVRHAAAAGGNAVVHAWATRTAPDMPGKGAAAAELNAELALALQAHNRAEVLRLIACGASIDRMVLPNPGASLLALLADCDSGLLDEHLERTGKAVTHDDLRQARSQEALLRLVERCDLKQMLDQGKLDHATMLATKAVQLDCADLLKKVFALYPDVTRPWAGVQQFSSMMGMMQTPLKAAIEKRDPSMVSLLLRLGTVPTSVELRLAEETQESIARVIDAAYQGLSEERRV